jgi:hypothetical protein
MKAEVFANIGRQEHIEFRSISFVFCGRVLKEKFQDSAY